MCSLESERPPAGDVNIWCIQELQSYSQKALSGYSSPQYIEQDYNVPFWGCSVFTDYLLI